MAERVALITGASAGIGAELTRVFASKGHRVAMVARRADRLTALAGEIVAAGGAAPIVIACDLTQMGAGDKIAEALTAAGVEVDTSSTMRASACSAGRPSAIAPISST